MATSLVLYLRHKPKCHVRVDTSSILACSASSNQSVALVSRCDTLVESHTAVHSCHQLYNNLYVTVSDSVKGGLEDDICELQQSGIKPGFSSEHQTLVEELCGLGRCISPKQHNQDNIKTHCVTCGCCTTSDRTAVPPRASGGQLRRNMEP